MQIQPIGYIQTLLTGKFSVPRQGNLISELYSCIRLVKPYNNPQAVEELETFSHLWLIGYFHANAHADNELRLKVRPPRLGGNKKVGVFASRSPFRPNNLSLSLVKLEQVIYHAESNELLIVVSGCDLIDQTPIIDIKPYIPFADSPILGQEVRSGYVSTLAQDLQEPEAKQDNEEDNFTQQGIGINLGTSQATFPAFNNVVWNVDEEILANLALSLVDLDYLPSTQNPQEASLHKHEYLQRILFKLLALHPQPAYKKDKTLQMGMEFAGLEVQWQCSEFTSEHALWQTYLDKLKSNERKLAEQELSPYELAEPKSAGYELEETKTTITTTDNPVTVKQAKDLSLFAQDKAKLSLITITYIGYK
ncbi:tRNA (N6-threonylcarbamoyladenosine(37)-N6)-methyltransferase TrmO [Psittacicella hinzii]|uniref:tRNA (N6-threonylcarbamoyladenosine(37)-N6)-methyltransferase TrmO n=1 Tax=Psittacicella hinzii TaxID=2028575 RepID=A0A3A1YMN8_9GAMM|nr:tRNA (N6-threonylcarbamoyladenosine(37)-N6)-methyltransferase TrmO [Psittacicella hinzii]RIY38821.1 tRNA (N6-threonylcarbamoyladenosine(37)-N6)-methyltransferase TrmO [Psittacicella hinzii]